MPSRWYDIRAEGAQAEIFLYDGIGSGGVRGCDFVEAVRALGAHEAIDLHLFSNGGDVFEGVLILDDLVTHAPKGANSRSRRRGGW